MHVHVPGHSFVGGNMDNRVYICCVVHFTSSHAVLAYLSICKVLAGLVIDIQLASLKQFFVLVYSVWIPIFLPEHTNFHLSGFNIMYLVVFSKLLNDYPLHSRYRFVYAGQRRLSTTEDTTNIRLLRSHV